MRGFVGGCLRGVVVGGCGCFVFYVVLGVSLMSFRCVVLCLMFYVFYMFANNTHETTHNERTTHTHDNIKNNDTLHPT